MLNKLDKSLTHGVYGSHFTQMLFVQMYNLPAKQPTGHSRIQGRSPVSVKSAKIRFNLRSYS